MSEWSTCLEYGQTCLVCRRTCRKYVVDVLKKVLLFGVSAFIMLS